MTDLLRGIPELARVVTPISQLHYTQNSERKCQLHTRKVCSVCRNRVRYVTLERCHL